MTTRDSSRSNEHAHARVIVTANGNDFRTLAAEYAVEALNVLRAGLKAKDEKVRFQAARDLAFVASRLPPKEAPPAELDGARLSALFENPPPELRAHLESYRRRENAKDAAAVDVNEVESTPKD
jgi:hypothetical protein